MKSRVVGVVAFLLWVVAAGPPALAQFETRASFDVGHGPAPYSLVLGDFNQDGNLDAAVVLDLRSRGAVEILLGNGDGTFRYGPIYKVGVSPSYAATASLRHNGILDLVLGGFGADAAYVMLGNGDGTFQAPARYQTSGEPEMVELGNFTGSGNVDILAVEDTSTRGVVCDCIEVLPGKGDGTFGAPIKTPLSNMTPFAIASGDFNNDGKVDVAVSGDPGVVDIFLGKGDGTFTADGDYTVSEDPGSIAVGYFTSDKKKLDLAVANLLGSSLSVLLGNGDGTFQQSVYYETYFPTWGDRSGSRRRREY